MMIFNIIFLPLVIGSATSGQLVQHDQTSNEKSKPQNYEWGDFAKLTSKNNTFRENQIAAIFRGVAYGAPTEKVMTTQVFEENSKELTSLSTTATEVITQPSTPYFITNRYKNNMKGKSKFNEVDANEKGAIHSEKHINNDFGDEFTFGSANNKDKSLVINSQDKTIQKTTVSTQLENNNVHKVTNVDQRIKILLEWSFVKEELGLGWTIHVYITGLGFSILAGITIVALFWGSWWPIELGRCRRTFLHLIIFTLAVFRAIGTFLDPYGASGILPHFVSLFLNNSVAPLITAILSILLPVLLIAGDIDIFLLTPILLYIITLIHICASVGADVATCLLQSYGNVLSAVRVGVQAITAGWGAALCLGYVAMLCKIVRKNERFYDNSNRYSNPHVNLMAFSTNNSVLKKTARFGTAGATCQLLLSALTVYTLICPEEPPSPTPLLTWIWLCQHSVARTLELIACITILIAAGSLKTIESSGQGHSMNKRQFMCPTMPSWCICCTSCTGAGVHPTKTKMKQPLTIFTIQKKNQESNSTDYVTSDFQLVWNKGRAYVDHPTSEVVSENDMLKYHSEIKESINPLYEKTLRQKRKMNQSLTLPRNMARQNHVTTTHGEYDNIRKEEHIMNYEYSTHQNLYHQRRPNYMLNNYKMVGTSLTPQKTNGKQRLQTEGNNQTVGTSISGSSASYWVPHISPSKKMESNRSESKSSRSLDFLATSEMPIKKPKPIDNCEYVTDMSSSIEGLITDRLPVLTERRWHPVHTLPRKPRNSAIIEPVPSCKIDNVTISPLSPLQVTHNISSSAPPTAPASISSTATTPEDEETSRISQDSSIVTYVNISPSDQQL